MKRCLQLFLHFNDLMQLKSLDFTYRGISDLEGCRAVTKKTEEASRFFFSHC
jgi:hypothetical protein